MKSKPTVDDVQLLVSKMITNEQDEWADLIQKISSRDPKGSLVDLGKLEVVHTTRLALLEQIYKTIKNMKAKG